MDKRAFIPLGIVLVTIITFVTVQISLRIPKGWRIYGLADGMADDWITSLATAPDGSLWVGHIGSVSHYDLDTQQWTAYTTEDGVLYDVIEAIAVSADGVVWFGSGAGLMSYDPRIDRWKTDYPTINEQENPRIQAIAVAPDNSIWMGTEELGVFQFDPGTETWRQYTIDDGLLRNEIESIAISPEGIVWLATWNGLSRFDPAKQGWISFAPLPDVESLAVARDGSIWIGGVRGIARFEETRQKWTVYTTEDGLPDGRVSGIEQAPDGTIWIGMWREGIARLDEQTNTWKAYDRKDGFPCQLEDRIFGAPCEHVRSIAVSNDGMVWIGASQSDGLVRFDPNLYEGRD